MAASKSLDFLSAKDSLGITSGSRAPGQGDRRGQISENCPAKKILVRCWRRFFGNDKNDERVHAESRLQKHKLLESWHSHYFMSGKCGDIDISRGHSQERHSKRPRGSPQRKITIVTMRRVFKRLILPLRSVQFSAYLENCASVRPKWYPDYPYQLRESVISYQSRVTQSVRSWSKDGVLRCSLES